MPISYFTQITHEHGLLINTRGMEMKLLWEF